MSNKRAFRSFLAYCGVTLAISGCAFGPSKGQRLRDASQDGFSWSLAQRVEKVGGDLEVTVGRTDVLREDMEAIMSLLAGLEGRLLQMESRLTASEAKILSREIDVLLAKPVRSVRPDTLNRR